MLIPLIQNLGQLGKQVAPGFFQSPAYFRRRKALADQRERAEKQALALVKQIAKPVSTEPDLETEKIKRQSALKLKRLQAKLLQITAEQQRLAQQEDDELIALLLLIA